MLFLRAFEPRMSTPPEGELTFFEKCESELTFTFFERTERLTNNFIREVTPQ
jgi:hypothetical protein